MGSEIEATTAQLLQRQASSSRTNLRQYAFAASIANRFYTDASLARQQRAADVTKRRQAKAHARATEQAYRVEKLQQELAETERLRALKEARETARMRLKVSHVAALYIQFIWRKHIRNQCARERRIAQASKTVTRYIRKYIRRTRQRREIAAQQIQQTWRLHLRWREQAYHRQVVERTLWRWVRAHRLKSRFATILQRWYRKKRRRHRFSAARCIQLQWRRMTLWRTLFRFVDEELCRQRREKEERCACILQRTFAKHTVYRRLIKMSELAEFPAVMAHSWRELQLLEPTAPGDSRALQNAQEASRQLKWRETALRTHVEHLHKQLEAAQAALADEHERVRRHASVEEYRRVKDDQLYNQRLHEVEGSMRRQIREEIERELETARRLMIRSKRRGSTALEGASTPSSHSSQDTVDARVETL